MAILCSRSIGPSYIFTYYLKWVKISKIYAEKICNIVRTGSAVLYENVWGIVLQINAIS